MFIIIFEEEKKMHLEREIRFRVNAHKMILNRVHMNALNGI